MFDPIETGQRRTAVILGQPLSVRIVEPSAYEPEHWICRLETSGTEWAIAEYEIRERLPDVPTGMNDAVRATTFSMPVPEHFIRF